MDMKNSSRKNPTSNYRLARQYGVTSFIAIAVTAVVILLFFRFETIQIIEDATKRSNETLTIATEYALNDHFVMFLNIVKQNKDQKISSMPLEPLLERVIQKMLTDTNVDRIKLYDRSGKVIYSSSAMWVDDEEENNDAFQSALAGKPKTKLVYRDAFNALDKELDDVNLVMTYVPIRASDTSPVLGVMEIYSDINDYVSKSNKTIIILVLITLGLMFFLYSFLLLHIKRSERIIEDQNRITQEKKKMLEFLTAKMINAQEDEKKRIAFALHEDVVQTLSGVKMLLERYIQSVDKIDEESSAKQLSEDIVPVLQDAAHKIRSVAIDLRPPSLDDFGLKAALNSLISECHTVTSGLEIRLELSFDENEITLERKAILYRILKEALQMICFEEKLVGKVQFYLQRTREGLLIRGVIISDRVKEKYNDVLPGFLESMQERTILSGGDFSIIEQADNRLEVNSSWFY
ncbi:MAG: hypothetical protein KZQ88_14510 [Candidatus Thiodiazotropha sp. (ex Dulcina madagascariensis)]|nr:hypothetical protein [Candidatus Thiodiazotropha sp. (ex Dulcina madagascariensis)]MCU7926690.1 hypothetical protein [Candidatus Thiodiazotropha sp. (ex Dulcina madagascariensis)]